MTTSTTSGREYSGILQDQLVRGNNGLTKRKFLTFTIEADNLKMARAV